jgi:hypothetical protein
VGGLLYIGGLIHGEAEKENILENIVQLIIR